MPYKETVEVAEATTQPLHGQLMVYLQILYYPTFSAFVRHPQSHSTRNNRKTFSSQANAKPPEPLIKSSIRVSKYNKSLVLAHPHIVNFFLLHKNSFFTNLFPFLLSGFMDLPVSNRRTSYYIETQNLSYTFQNPYDQFRWLFFYKAAKTSPQNFIIKNVNLEARPGEITAIAGPSGAGKTTLLEILAGKIPSSKFSGLVLVNNRPPKAETFRRLSGYVSQDDALFPLLTVQETLTYSALLRLPGGKRVVSRRVQVLMKELGLDHLASSKVGEVSNRGISGGERRRVSIGVELVHDPDVLFLDEPTSGLDSASALHIVSLLRFMVVTHGKTIILTIHQPGFRILELFNKLVLISNGCILHNGSLHLLEDRLKYAGHCVSPHINVLEFAIEIANTLRIQTSNSDNGIDHKQVQENASTSPANVNSQFREILILSERFSKNIFRTKELFATRVIQAILVGCILGTVYMDVKDDQGKAALQTRLGFFAFNLSFLLSSTTEGLPIFLQERKIFMRETLRGAYRVSSYVIANTIVFFPFFFMVALLYSTPVYWLVGLRHDVDGFLYFTLVVWMVVLMSNSFTACCSALVPNFIMGTSVIAGLMGSFFLFSGYFIAQENIPSYWIFMHYLSLFKYPFESLMINEYGGNGGRKCLQNIEGQCVLNGKEYLRQQGFKEPLKWSNLCVMLGFIFGYRFLCYCILWYRSYRTKK